MAGFTLAGSNLKALEDDVKSFAVPELPLNITTSAIIGEGSSSVVFKYQMRGKLTAVKRFKAQLSKKCILKAAKALLVLKHENITKFIGYSCRPSAILFEYCGVKFYDNESDYTVHSLKELIDFFNDHEYFNLNERAGFCAQACKGLCYLHSLNIIHKDIKPSNMLVSGTKEEIVVKISDFNELASFKDTCLTTTTTADNGLKGMNITFFISMIYIYFAVN